MPHRSLPTAAHVLAVAQVLPLLDRKREVEVTNRNTYLAWKIIGPAPWICHFCHKLIEKRGRGSSECHAHHLDGDKTNDTVENVVPTHGLCHHQHHHKMGDYSGFTGHKHSEETKAEMSRTRKGTNHRPIGTYRHSDEVKEKISAVLKGKKQTPEHIAKKVASRRKNAAKRGKW